MRYNEKSPVLKAGGLCSNLICQFQYVLENRTNLFELLLALLLIRILRLCARQFFVSNTFYDDNRVLGTQCILSKLIKQG